jgi:SAM-dependent methyltransferase
MRDVTDRVESYTANTDFWVKIIREDLDPYRIALTNRAVLDAVGDVEGLTVLDGGCAEGYLARELARRGAKAIGIDSCGPLINAAREAAESEGLAVDYQVADLADIPSADASYDVVVLNHVVHDMEDPAAVFAEIARVTRPGGRLVIMMLHPCFYNSSRADRTAGHGHPVPTAYFSVRPVQQPFVVSGITSPAPVTVWLRPLEAYASLLFDNGFVIAGLSEPHPTDEQLASDPWWAEHFVRPLFLLVTAEKKS